MNTIKAVAFLTLIFVLGINPAFAQNITHKIDPSLKRMIDAIQRDTPQGVLRKAAEAHLPIVRVLIKGHPTSVQNAIIQIGGSVEAVVGNVTSARIAPTTLLTLAANPAIERIEKVGKKTPLNTEAARQVGATSVQSGTTPLTLAYTGSGVIVGIIDSGIDFRHKDFRDPSDPSKSRILYIWDQEDETGPPPQGFSYGTLWTKAQIEQDFRGEIQVTQSDPNGHGTHVAGSAAGNGSALGKYKGTAPEADIIFVKGLQDPVDASTFIFGIAETLNKPAVINYSAGGHAGAHDGASLEETTLEQLATSVPGRAFVTAAGNEGADFIHWGGFNLGTDSLWTYYMADVSAPLADNETGGLLANIEIYGVISQTDVNNTFLSVGVDTTGVQGSIITPLGARDQTPWYSLNTLLALPGSSSDTLRYGNGEMAGIVAITASPTDNNKVLLTLSIIDFVTSQDDFGFDAVGADMWRLIAKGSGTIHMWSEKVWSAENPSVNVQISESQYRATDNNYTVGMPATATKLITVGAYTNINVEDEPLAKQGGLATFSSKGPTADGRNKPDIIAPGQFVYSVLSSAYTEADPSTIDAGGIHYREQGTSMASPIAAGSIALYLQQNPKATYTELYTALTTRSKKDDFTTTNGTLPNTFWGHGKLDIFAMMTPASPPSIPTNPLARADFSGDGNIGFSDFLTFARLFGKKSTDSDFDARVDLNDDNAINFPDFLIFAQLFGQNVTGD